MSKAVSSNSKFAFVWRRGLAAALIITGLPAGLIAMQSYKLQSGKTLNLQVQSVQFQAGQLIPALRIETQFNKLPNRQIASDSQFVIGETAYVFLSPGPENIWYPYALTRRRSAEGCNSDECLMLTGKIEKLTDTHTFIRYGFEDVLTANLPAYVANQPQDIQSIMLSVSNGGNGVLKSYNFKNRTYAQRKLPIPTLDGFKKIGDSIAPPK